MITTLFVILTTIPTYAVEKKGSISGTVSWAKKTCEDANVGYRYGASHGAKTVEGDKTYYDCSAFVYWALKEGGSFDVDNAGGCFSTHNEAEVIGKLGYEEGSTSGGWKAGDIFVSDTHTMLAASDGSGSSANVYHASTSTKPFPDQVLYAQGASLSGYKIYNFKGKDTGGSAADTTPLAKKMKDSLKDEISKADKSFVSDTTIVTITKKTIKKGYMYGSGYDSNGKITSAAQSGSWSYYQTHIVVSSANQFVCGYTSDDLTKSQSVMTTDKYLNDVKGIVASNGGNFDLGSTNRPDMPGHSMGSPHGSLLIHQGKKVEGTAADGREICYDNSGALSRTGTKTNDAESADALLARGCIDTIICGSPRLISKDSGGERYKDQVTMNEASTDGGGWYKRTILAMVQPGEYYIITGIDPITYAMYREICWDLNCVFAKALDSGGSTSLAFRKDNKGNAEKVFGCSRDVPSFIYIREFKEGDPLLGGGTISGSPEDGDNDGNSAVDDANANANGSGERGDKWLDEDDPRLLLQEDVKKLSDSQKDVELIDRTDLDSKDIASIDKNSKDMKIQNENRVIFAVRTGVALVGLIMFLYGVFVLLAYFFDRANIYTRGSLLGLITFGLAYHDESNDNEKEKRHTRKQVIIIVAVFIIVGSLLVSGTVYKVAYNMITWANNKFFG